MRRLLVVLAVALVLPAVGGAAPRFRQIDHDPVVSPSGRQVAFLRHRTGDRSWWIWVMRSDGRGARRVARAGEHARLAWSPDSRLIAFGGVARLFVVPPGGGRVRVVADHSDDWAEGIVVDEWRRDGTIVYTLITCCRDHLHEYYTHGVDVRGRPRALITVECDEAEQVYGFCENSPDGRRAAWTANTNTAGYGTVKVRNARGAEPTTIGAGCCPKFSPDGRRLLFHAGTENAAHVAVANADGTGVRALTGPFSSVAATWAPAGDAIAFRAPAAGKLQLWYAALDGSGTRRVTNEATGVADAHVGEWWSPKGTWLVYPVQPKRGVLAVAALRRDGTGRRELLRWHIGAGRSGFYASAFGSMRWSSDERFLVYYDSLGPGCASGAAVYRVDVEPPKRRRLTNTCRSR